MKLSVILLARIILAFFWAPLNASVFSLVIDYTLPCIIVFSEYVSSVLPISKLFESKNYLSFILSGETTGESNPELGGEE